MTIQDALYYGEQILEDAGVPDAKHDAWFLLADLLQMDRSAYYLRGQEEITPEQKEDYRILVKKRAERIPLQYILGAQEFMGIPIKVNSNVLIPRQDTEVLVSEAAKLLRPQESVLDMCTGSGCILLALLSMVPDLQGTGVDISKQALLVAKENATENALSATWICSNLFEKVDGTFDMIVSNPPYIPTEEISTLMPEVQEFEPVSALDGGLDGLDFYRILAEQAPRYLCPGGYFLCEIGYNQAEDVSDLLAIQGFIHIQVIQDLAGKDRVVRGQLPA